mgnify:CR=1 FL=1
MIEIGPRHLRYRFQWKRGQRIRRHDTVCCFTIDISFAFGTILLVYGLPRWLSVEQGNDCPRCDCLFWSRRGTRRRQNSPVTFTYTYKYNCCVYEMTKKVRHEIQADNSRQPRNWCTEDTGCSKRSLTFKRISRVRLFVSRLGCDDFFSLLAPFFLVLVRAEYLSRYWQHTDTTRYNTSLHPIIYEGTQRRIVVVRVV